ncbi:peptidoglycan-binding domain-containing protein [Actinophytocola xanthii]|uniref:peptidoglycan-binding domain-containing protein n=1 Tax=Actinophytocola xanthii TaxID=1912961 RepID=UPI001178120B|nr:peptidoglycan-binding protein [Actinophytocola xanthii]
MTVLLVVLATFVATTGNSSAHPSNGGVTGSSFVDGAGALTDDFGDHRGELGNSLCNGCADSFNTDLVVLWQAILVSEGFLGYNDLDGQFGPRTAAATRSWQGLYIGGSGVDGEVGNQTWSRADDFLVWGSPVNYLDNFVVYLGNNGGHVGFYRGNENLYHDSGAYELVFVQAPNAGTTWVASGSRIQFYSLTVT